MSGVGGWYHCSVKTVSRSAGRSIVAAAAYRLAECLHDRETGDLHDYRRKSGVIKSFTLAPSHAPAWAYNPELLWNAAERRETRINSQTGRECELALPASVSAEEREAIATAFAHALVERYGVAVTVALHKPSRDGDERNFHAHILMTTRRMEADGLGAKTRVLDDRKTGPKEVLYLRELACDLINGALERAGLDERVDHRSFEDRGIDQEPTEHLGPGATEAERHGWTSERGDTNREIDAGNGHLDKLHRDLAALDAEIMAEQERLLDQQYGAFDVPDYADEPEEAPRDWFDIPQTAAEEEALLDRAAAPFEEQIRATGEIHHWGLLGGWVEYAASVGQWIYETARDFVRGAWQLFVESRRGNEDRSKDDGPDMTR